MLMEMILKYFGKGHMFMSSDVVEKSMTDMGSLFDSLMIG